MFFLNTVCVVEISPLCLNVFWAARRSTWSSQVMQRPIDRACLSLKRTILTSWNLREPNCFNLIWGTGWKMIWIWCQWNKQLTQILFSVVCTAVWICHLCLILLVLCLLFRQYEILNADTHATVHTLIICWLLCMSWFVLMSKILLSLLLWGRQAGWRHHVPSPTAAGLS